MPLYLFCLVYCFQVGLLYNRWNWAILDLHAMYLHLKITMWLLLFLMCLPQCAVVGCCSLLGIHSPISSHLVQWLWTLSYQITSTECHLPISQYRRNLWCRRCPIISEGMNGTGLSLRIDFRIGTTTIFCGWKGYLARWKGTLKFLGFGVWEMEYSTFLGKKCGALCAKNNTASLLFLRRYLLQCLLPTYLRLRYATNYELQKYSPNVDWDSNLHLWRDVWLAHHRSPSRYPFS